MLGRETTVEALGKKWTFGRVELRRIEDFRDWIKTRIGDPFHRANDLLDRAEKQPPGSLQESLTDLFGKEWKKAKDVAEQLECFTLACPLAQQWMKTEAGAAKLACILLAGAHPDIDDNTALNVFLAVGEERLNEILKNGMGKIPGGAVKNVVAPATRAS